MPVSNIVENKVLVREYRVKDYQIEIFQLESNLHSGYVVKAALSHLVCMNVFTRKYTRALEIALEFLNENNPHWRDS